MADLLLRNVRPMARENCDMLIEGGRIVGFGHFQAKPGMAVEDGGGAIAVPGLIDAHTHLVFAGDRIAEFELRQKGASYEEIARAGGGIASTVAATRAASEAALVRSALPRLDALIAEGVTTIEIKSGYGLTLTDEAKMLRAARALGEARPVAVRTTFLGAHALPGEFVGDPDGYIALLCEQVLPAIAAEGLADAVDAFCENIGFTPAQTERMFAAAAARGLPVKLHAEQLSNQHGAALAARHGALSADHLEYLDEPGIAAMRDAGTVAMLLPGAFYYLREKQHPPLAALRARTTPYPEALKAALRQRFEGEAHFSLENAEKSTARGDTVYIAGCVFRSVACLCQSLHAINGVFLLNEKGAVSSVTRLARKPAAFADRATMILHDVSERSYASGLERLGELIDESRAIPT